MKKLFTIIVLALISFAIQAQNCQAFYTFTADSSGLASFTDQSTSQFGTVTSWFWDFGDGTSSTLQNATHQYALGMEYLICLTITTSDSCTSTSCDSLFFGGTPGPCVGFSMTANVTPVSTPAANDGAIDITLTGGTPPFNYVWDSGLPTTQNASNLSGGTYCLQVTDMAGCTLSNCYTVFEDSTFNPCQIYVTGNVVDETIAGANDGSIDITVFGGTQPYSYYWNTGQSTEDISGLTSGTYTVYIEDMDSCTAAITFFVDVDGGQTGQWDSLYTNLLDTCVGFIVDTAFASNYYWIDSTTVSVTWTLAGGGQVATIDVVYEVYTPGYNYIILAINCGTKAISNYMDLVYFDPTLTSINDVVETNPMLISRVLIKMFWGF